MKAKLPTHLRILKDSAGNYTTSLYAPSDGFNLIPSTEFNDFVNSESEKSEYLGITHNTIIELSDGFFVTNAYPLNLESWGGWDYVKDVPYILSEFDHSFTSVKGEFNQTRYRTIIHPDGSGEFQFIDFVKNNYSPPPNELEIRYSTLPKGCWYLEKHIKYTVFGNYIENLVLTPVKSIKLINFRLKKVKKGFSSLKVKPFYE